MGRGSVGGPTRLDEHYGLKGTVPKMRLYDTGRGEIVDFTPGPLVTLYVCGITPYDATHLGHAATYVTYDVLQRRLLLLQRRPRPRLLLSQRRLLLSQRRPRPRPPLLRLWQRPMSR